ncbi:MAG TPA: DUF2934 domain-containing protein [Clostridia bacterium]|nr:DUF2934 domain-containing protein [Clostridia bacterium]
MARVKKGAEEAAAKKKTTSRVRKDSSASGAAAAAALAEERAAESTPNPARVGTVTNIEDEIRRRAFELYLERNGQGGSPADDWARAEAEIRARRSA